MTAKSSRLILEKQSVLNIPGEHINTMWWQKSEFLGVTADNT